jgi:hypothetical protein
LFLLPFGNIFLLTSHEAHDRRATTNGKREREIHEEEEEEEKEGFS